MYLPNKYTIWYYNIITKASLRVNQPGYTEKHHIIPKSLGGSNDPLNLVRLTAKEHFVCHRLLVKMTEGNDKRKMAHAAWGMAHLKNPYQTQRYKVTSNIYASLKPYMKKSPESIERMRAKLKGRKKPIRTAEHSAKLGQYDRTLEHRKVISDARKAQVGLQTRTSETKVKMSAWQKGIPKPKVSCEHCKKEASLMNYKKWHGGNCKLVKGN
jgi:hypothetical protein